MSRASSKLSEAGNQGSMSKVGVRVIHGNIEILSELSISQGAYYTWGCIIHGNLFGIVRIPPS